jgi:hypothetical protein
VSQQAVSQRLRCLPAGLFERVLLDVLPRLEARWQDRQRPVPPALARARRRFSAVLALDGSTLDALLRKVGLLREADRAPLAGRMAALLDVITPLPRRVWYEADAQASDQRFWARAVAAVPREALLLFDGGFLNYAHYDPLTERGVWFLTRAAARMAYRVERVLAASAERRDLLVWVGSHPDHRCAHLLRLIEVRRPGGWHRYLTNVTDPQRLSAEDAAALYGHRWRVEDACLAVKRLLGLAYFWTGAINGVLVQLWATWLLYAALVDLTDAVADELGLPYRDVSLEMVYRGLYHFTQAYHRGEATEVVAYLAAHAQLLGPRKRRRRPSSRNGNQSW